MTDWPKSSATNGNASGPEGTFSIEKLKAAVRKLDALVSDDVIAVTQFCHRDKGLDLADDKGRIFVISPYMLHRLKKASQPKSGDVNPMLIGGSFPLGLPVIYADEQDEAAKAVRERIKRSVDAAVEVQAWWDSWK